ncbi:MAG: hypothetical protein MI810_15440 [Flavobacteriales bacterium]|nr:hypothetical protein [Flavobacteriales bacterium]
MKKLIGIAIIGILALSITSCGGGHGTCDAYKKADYTKYRSDNERDKKEKAEKKELKKAEKMENAKQAKSKEKKKTEKIVYYPKFRQ